MSNQPNEAAIYALSLLHLGAIDWLPVLGTHRLNGHAARAVLAAIRDGKVPGVRLAPIVGPGLRDQWRPGNDGVATVDELWAHYCERGDHIAGQSEMISSLRSALAAAEKDRAASARDWEAALGAHDRRAEELNQALAKLAEAEKERDEFAEKVGELAFIRHNLTKERDALAAQLAEARGLFPLPGEPAVAAEILDGVIDFFESLRDPGPCHRDHHGGCQEHGYLGLSPTEKCPMEEIPERLEWLRGHQKWLRDVADFLTPPSDRGAEDRA